VFGNNNNLIRTLAIFEYSRKKIKNKESKIINNKKFMFRFISSLGRRVSPWIHTKEPAAASFYKAKTAAP